MSDEGEWWSDTALRSQAMNFVLDYYRIGTSNGKTITDEGGAVHLTHIVEGAKMVYDFLKGEDK
jgi:hypothetical protein